jgi:hypothetical protein
MPDDVPFSPKKISDTKKTEETITGTKKPKEIGRLSLVTNCILFNHFGLRS